MSKKSHIFLLKIPILFYAFYGKLNSPRLSGVVLKSCPKEKVGVLFVDFYFLKRTSVNIRQLIKFLFSVKFTANKNVAVPYFRVLRKIIILFTHTIISHNCSPFITGLRISDGLIHNLIDTNDKRNIPVFQAKCNLSTLHSVFPFFLRIIGRIVDFCVSNIFACLCRSSIITVHEYKIALSVQARNYKFTHSFFLLLWPFNHYDHYTIWPRVCQSSLRFLVQIPFILSPHSIFFFVFIDFIIPVAFVIGFIFFVGLNPFLYLFKTGISSKSCHEIFIMPKQVVQFRVRHSVRIKFFQLALNFFKVVLRKRISNTLSAFPKLKLINVNFRINFHFSTLLLNHHYAWKPIIVQFVLCRIVSNHVIRLAQIVSLSFDKVATHANTLLNITIIYQGTSTNRIMIPVFSTTQKLFQIFVIKIVLVVTLKQAFVIVQNFQRIGSTNFITLTVIHSLFDSCFDFSDFHSVFSPFSYWNANFPKRKPPFDYNNSITYLSRCVKYYFIKER
nr:MAG TPA: hypothetical protein [Caudoviricetes sp.]